ncbi:hypothetical protein [Arenibacterium halophilum]|nr:hypothetical protein [Arenibacterium halophilum]
MRSRPLALMTRLADCLKPTAQIGAQPSGSETPLGAFPPPRPETHISIPMRELTEDTTRADAARTRGQFLARQDMWDTLLHEIHQADMARATTGQGLPVAELLAFGARTDVVQAADTAIRDGCACDDPALTAGINALEALRHDLDTTPDTAPYLATILAQTHLDIGWAWRGNDWRDGLPEDRRQKCAAHFDRATGLMAPYNGVELNSPLVAATQCALLAGASDPNQRISDDYEDLIDLDPHNFRHMRALGHYLLPRWFGSYAELDRQAKNTAARTRDIWGDGGYTWVCFDAIARDAGAFDRLDADRFIAGLHDIVAARPDQATVNLLAAYCALTLPLDASSDARPNDRHADKRARVAASADWLIRDHLTELHPMIWAHALDRFDNNATVGSVERFAARGRRSAFRVLGEVFGDDIRRGTHITFTETGLSMRSI